MKNILKQWYFEWLNKNLSPIMHSAIKDQMYQHNFKEDVDYWMKHHAQNNIHYTHFVSACANNGELIDGIVESIKRKQIN